MVTLKLLSGWNPWFFLSIAITLAAIAWWLYRREIRELGLGSISWVLPTLRAIAVFLIVLTLAEPALESRHREGEPGHVHILIDGSSSMSIVDSSIQASSQQPGDRFSRAVASLVTPTTGLVDQLSDQFDISVWRLDESGNALLWKSSLGASSEIGAISSKWNHQAFSSRTALGDGLSQISERTSDQAVDVNAQGARSTIVLMSDGQSNFGSSTETASEQIAKLNISVNTVGFGPEPPSSDLILKSIEVPPRLFKTDKLSGRLIVADLLPKGSDYQVQLLFEDKTVWQRDFTANEDAQREIRFDLPVADLYSLAVEQLPPSVQYNTLPIKLTAKLIAASSEQSLANNQLDAHLIVGASRAKILLVDGRSRWETRYVKNLFSRDPAWQIQTLVGEEGTKDSLPQSRADWQQFHLVVLGDIRAAELTDGFQSALVDFVNRGGGLIISDGARRHLHQSDFATLSPLLPVRLLDVPQGDASGRDGEKVSWSSQVTTAGQQLSALNLDSKDLDQDNQSDQSANLWKQLPSLEFVQSVSIKTGAETLVEAVKNGQDKPLIVSQRFGAGQVVYLASDETWRWRYKVADQIHQRFWNQIARWVMRKPMSVESEYLSLDSGQGRYFPGQSIEVRAALRQPNGSPAEGLRTVAVVSREGLPVARINLTASENSPGTYMSLLSDLPVGDYEVSIEAEGFTKDALLAKSTFSVTEPLLSTEMLSTNCDSRTLKGISQITAGHYLHESQIDRLPDLLRPLSGGKYVHSTRLIWQSYYWFFAALGLLAVEWVLRKRAGLI